MIEIGLLRMRRQPVPIDAYAALLSALFLIGLDSRLFRENSYFVVVTPLTAALCARPLAGMLRIGHGELGTVVASLATAGRAARQVAAFGVFFLSGVGMVGYLRPLVANLDEWP